MELDVIYTDRYFNAWPSWHIIYEWEDIISESLGLQLVDSRKAFVISKYADKALRFLSRKVSSRNGLLPAVDKLVNKKKGLYFELMARSGFYFTGSKNTIPVIIDFWKSHDITTFNQAYKNCPAVLISSLEVYNYLKENNCPLPVFHFPLSLPDKYKLSAKLQFKKKYDIVIPGRANPALWEYLLTYEKQHPGIEYLYQKGIDNELYYFSNINGMVGKFHDRESYIGLLRAAKVSFYSTPGIDGDEKRSGGFSPVTPRFLEIVAAGCKVIARYPKNAETDFYKMDNIALSCDDYPVFERELSKALADDDVPYAKNAGYLTRHYTSQRANLLKDILSGLN